jgi:CHASE2 domain-containing sensor protein
MDSRSLADIPLSVIALILLSGISGTITISPLVMFSGWVLFVISIMFLSFANVISGGYKNDWHRNIEVGNQWREISIAVALLLGLFGFFTAFSLWKKIDPRSTLLLLAVVITSLFLGYCNVMFRYKVFRGLTPEEKEEPIKLSELKKYIRWYHWLIFITIGIFLIPFIFS